MTDYSALITFGVPLTMSDVRAKRDIVPLARLENGIGLYRYRYMWSDDVYVGVMAQEVPARRSRARHGWLLASGLCAARATFPNVG